MAAEKQGDLFGLLTFGDKVGNFVRARNGKEHYGACREALYRLEAQSVFAPGLRRCRILYPHAVCAACALLISL